MLDFTCLCTRSDRCFSCKSCWMILCICDSCLKCFLQCKIPGSMSFNDLRGVVWYWHMCIDISYCISTFNEIKSNHHASCFYIFSTKLRYYTAVWRVEKETVVPTELILLVAQWNSELQLFNLSIFHHYSSRWLSFTNPVSTRPSQTKYGQQFWQDI